jgi:hypothetical protein
VVGVDGGVPPVVVDHGEPDELVASPHGEGLGRQVEGRALPVGDVVGLLDQHLTDVVELLGRDQRRDRRGVRHLDRTGGVTLRKGEGR